MVVVRLVKRALTGKRHYSPVDSYSFGLLMEATGFGWFRPTSWQRVKEQLVEIGCRLSNRWYDIQRRKEPEVCLCHLLNGESIIDYSKGENQ